MKVQVEIITIMREKKAMNLNIITQTRRRAVKDRPLKGEGMRDHPRKKLMISDRKRKSLSF